MSEAIHHPLKENLPLDQAIQILIETRSDPNIRYYDPKYRCLTCGRIGEEEGICRSSHQIQQGPCYRLRDLLMNHSAQLLHLCQDHRFLTEDMRILNLGTEFGDQALIDILLDNIFNHSWENWDQLKGVLIPIFRLIDHAKFVNIVIFSFRVRCYKNIQQFEERFDWYQIVKLYVEIMFKENPDLADLIKKLSESDKTYCQILETLPRIKSIDHNGDFNRLYEEFEEDYVVFEEAISAYLKNETEIVRTYAYLCDSTVQALQLHHYLISLDVNFDRIRESSKVKEAIQFESTVPLSELIELFDNKHSNNLPYQTLDYATNFNGNVIRS